MKVSGAGSTGIQAPAAGMGAGGQMDAVSKDLQNQIENLQKQMKELSSNQEMPAEAKMKKRQELQKQISNLEMQLRQHQIEVKREAAMEKKQENGAMDELLGVKQQKQQSDSRNTGMSAGSMEALISADMSMKQAGVHGSIANKMDNRAGVLETEIMLDSSRGGSSNIEFKKEELAKTQELADQATVSQMESLAQANKTMQEAAKDEQEDKTDKADNKEEDDKQNAGIAEEDNQNAQEENTFDAEMMGVSFSRGYQPVDIKL